MFARTEVKLKDLRTPWIPNVLENSSKQNETLYIIFIQSNSSEDELISTNYNIFKKLRKKSKENCNSNLLEKHKDNATQQLLVLKENTGKVQKKKLPLSNIIETENGIVSHKKSVAEEFNTFLRI